MHKPYLLALDLGTSSIGYVAFEIDDCNQPVGIIDLGVRIFPDGRDPKTKEPLAVSRRMARGIRRNRDRGQNRVRRLVRELIDYGLLPEDESEREKIFTEVNPYQARHLAVTESVSAHVLGRAIFHIGRRRGFKSNRLAGDAEESEYKAKISALRDVLGDGTLGQYLFARVQENKRIEIEEGAGNQNVIRFRNGETEFYADRRMYKEEFDRIRQVQGNTHLNDAQWDALAETTFWQYPLKPVPKGKCRFYPEETRAHIDLPITHEYRIYQEVNSLRYASGGMEHQLDDRQRNMLYDLLGSSKTVGFKALLKKKDSKKSPYFPSDATFNLDVASRNGKLHGNRVMCDLRKPELLGALADEMTSVELNDLVHHLIEPIKRVGGRDVVVEQSELEAWVADKLPALSIDQVTALCEYRFKRDTASVSRKFMQKIVPVLKETGYVFSDAVVALKEQGEQLHHSDFFSGEVVNRLPYYGEIMPESVWGAQPDADKNKSESERDNDAFLHGKIANPTVHVALNQLRFLVNRVIDRIGNAPTKIHVELTRDLKNSKDARDKIEKAQGRNKRDNDRIRGLLKDEHGFDHPSRDDVQKYKLWEELGSQGTRCCVFSGRSIGAASLFNGEVEVEHIIPFSRCYDDGMNNKTLAYKSANNIKGNRTPFEAFGNRPEYDDILKRALASFGQSSKYDRFKEGAFESFYGREKGTMIDRQLNDTKYISRKAAQYLGHLCHPENVVAVNGRMTALLRDVWQLNHFKDRDAGHYRDDHRHHIVDAFVVGLTSRSLIQQLNTRRNSTAHVDNNMYRFLKSRVEDIPELKSSLFELLDETVASYKPDHTSTGSMFNDTAYGIQKKGDQQVGVTRRAVSALGYGDVFMIRSASHRAHLIHHLTGGNGAEDKNDLKAYLGSDKLFDEAKKRFEEKTGINKLRIDVLNNSIQAIASAPFKGYAKNSYAYCDIWQIPKKKDSKTGSWSYSYEGVFVAYADVKRYQNQPARPIDKDGRSHPAAKKLMRVYKNDSLRLICKQSGSEEVFRVAGYKSLENRIDIRPNLQAKNEGKGYVSIQQVFQKYQVQKLRA